MHIFVIQQGEAIPRSNPSTGTNQCWRDAPVTSRDPRRARRVAPVRRRRCLGAPLWHHRACNCQGRPRRHPAL